jgi:mRNA interferase YafQ
MRTIEWTGQFKRDYGEGQGKHQATLDIELFPVIGLLKRPSVRFALPGSWLVGNWKDHRDCHIKPDLILIYRQEADALQLVRLGSLRSWDMNAWVQQGMVGGTNSWSAT